jgi:hypothetical protein
MLRREPRNGKAPARWVVAAILALPATRAALASVEPPAPTAPDPAGPAVADGPSRTHAASGDAGSGEVIEVTGSTPAAPGSIALDAEVARQTAGALGEPFRALSLLPGVTTSIAASGYPVIRGTLPGESRYEFDGIELPMLYHYLIGSQVIHPAFIGDLALRAGGQGAEEGYLIGGLVAMTPSRIAGARTELHANPVEIGVFHVQPLSPSTSLAVAARVTTLAITAKIYDPRVSLYAGDQEARLVHLLGNGDQLTLTSLAAYDYARLPPAAVPPYPVETEQVGFHRLDGRWSRTRADRKLRAGIETAIDSLHRTGVNGRSSEMGGRSYGVRAYADGSLDLAPWFTARAGLHARHRTLVNGASPFLLTVSDPFLGLARTVDAQGAWTAVDLRAGPVRFTPGLRADRYQAALYGSSVDHVTVDPRLAIAADLPAGVRAEIAVGAYSAPPQMSVVVPGSVIGPLPMSDGAGSLAGMNHATEAQLSVVMPLGGGLQGSFAAYYRDAHHAVDFGLAAGSFRGGGCGNPGVTIYRNVDSRALGVEAMIRRDLGRSVTGWLSYSLGEIDRDLGFTRLPGDFDQRHTLNATAQWRRGPWLFGATGHLHTGRPVPYRMIGTCSNGIVSEVSYPLLSRRTPIGWRIDLRVERALQVAGAQLRLYFELQNASFTRETLSYDAEDSGEPSPNAVPNTLLLPLPLIGAEVVL